MPDDKPVIDVCDAKYSRTLLAYVQLGGLLSMLRVGVHSLCAMSRRSKRSWREARLVATCVHIAGGVDGAVYLHMWYK